MARLIPSISEWRQPYLLSNFDLVTESFTLMAGKRSSPFLAMSTRRCTPVVVSSVTPLIPLAMEVQRPWSSARLSASAVRTTSNSSESAVDGSGTAPAFSNSTPLCTRSVASPPSSRIMLGPPSPGHSRAWRVHHQYSCEGLALPGEHRDALGIVDRAVRTDGHGGGGVVLGGEDVAAGPAHPRAERGQRLDQHGRLDRHVQRAGDAGPGQGLGRPELVPHRHQSGHLVLGQLDLLASERGQGEVGHLVGEG